MNQTSLDRNVLFGILALQIDLIDDDRFVAAMATWASEKSRPHGEEIPYSNTHIPSTLPVESPWRGTPSTPI
jgi:hypothetical protein